MYCVTRQQYILYKSSLQWRRIERGGVSNQRRLDCLLNRLFRRGSKKTSCSRHCFVWGESLATIGFPSQRASDAENVSILRRHHVVHHPIRLRPFNKLCTGEAQGRSASRLFLYYCWVQFLRYVCVVDDRGVGVSKFCSLNFPLRVSFNSQIYLN